MKIREYLQAKYGVDKPTTMTLIEAKAFGIPFPLRPDWLQLFGEQELTQDRIERAFRKLAVRGVRQEHRNGKPDQYVQRGIEILGRLLPKRVLFTPSPDPVKPTNTEVAESIKRTKAQLKAERRARKELKRGKRHSRPVAKPTSEGFYETREWREVRYKVLQKYAGRCMCCGRGAGQGVILHVDHIKPRSKFPELALSIENLQVLCEDCNLGKSNKDVTDWRGKEQQGRNRLERECWHW